MKTIFNIALLLTVNLVLAQTGTTVGKDFYHQLQTEKVYAHLNNVLYLPEETVFYKLYVTNADNTPTSQSDYVYVDVYDASDKKIDAQCYVVEQGGAEGSYLLRKDLGGGMYKIKAYTRLQQQLGEPAFEKHFFVQKVTTNRLLMTLDFKKEGYGPGETCEADFTLKSNDNQPLANHVFEYEVFIQGKNIQTLTGTTNSEGKAVLKFRLPDNVQANDGIVNVKVEYDGIKESVTRSIPISLYFADLQFLPESGNYIVGHWSNIFFIAKNEFGKPLDVGGYIQDSDGNKVAEFSSFYDGMGKVSFKPEAGKSYSAILTAPFKNGQAYALPQALATGYGFTLEDRKKALEINFITPGSQSCELLIRNNGKIYKSFTIDLARSQNYIVPIKGYPMGLYAVSMVIDNRIVAERLVFIGYEDGMSIDIKTDKEQYLPREKVQATITTKDKDGKPLASSLSVSVVDEKMLSYIDDKQHNLLTWMFFGNELKGNVHEPRFYFDSKETLEKRLEALDLLLNTHGWRRYGQKDVNGFDGSRKPAFAEKGSDVEGYVFDDQNKPAELKIYFISDTGKVYETKSDNRGYFKFTRTHFGQDAWIVAESRHNRTYTIKNSISDRQEFTVLHDTLSASGVGNIDISPLLKPTTTMQARPLPGQPQLYGDEIMLEYDSNQLEDVVVIGYGTRRMSNISASVSVISAEMITQSLTSRLAGVDITTASGQPGLSSTIRIRGTSSLNGNNEPLFVVDGMPMSREALSNFNTNDIESITILKDAGATAIYGSRGANGVVLITTKNKSYWGGGIILNKTNHYSYQNIRKYNQGIINKAQAFYAPVYASTETEEKTDFRNCIYWNGTVQTSKQGTAQVEFYNSDETSTFTLLAEGTSYKGDLGIGKHQYVVKEPVQTDVKLPLFATQEDVIKIPLWVKNNSDNKIAIDAVLEKSDYFEVTEGINGVTLAGNEAKTLHFTIKALKPGNKLQVKIKVVADGVSTTILKTIDIYGKGFPVSVSIGGTKSASGSFTIDKALDNTLKSELKFSMNPFSSLTDGLEAMLREPSGCFEQVSSSNYPNIMALQLLESKGGMDEDFKKKAIGYLKSGYRKLTGYGSKGGGYEWYGGNPGHEALTAYGLMQFYEMKQFIDTDPDVERRAIAWLLSRRDGKGGFEQRDGKYGFAGSMYEVTNAYIIYVLTEIGEKGIMPEYKAALAEALKSKDAYRSALMALAAYNLGDIPSYKQLLDNIRVYTGNGEYEKAVVEKTVVNSYNTSKIVEWVSLYALALMKEPGNVNGELIAALDYIQTARKYYGYGSTQATALALKAITAFNKIAQYIPGRPQVSAAVNNAALSNTLDKEGNVKVNTTGNILTGENTYNIVVEEGRMVPYLLSVNYQSYVPRNSPDCQMELSTKLTRTSVKVSETTRIEAVVTNKTNEVVYNPLVRIGLPGGTSPEPWQLKELVDKGMIDYYEIFGSELVLYFRAMGKNETRTINIDLKAQIPGNYLGIASSAYLYYNNEHKNWNEGLSVEIVP